MKMLQKGITVLSLLIGILACMAQNSAPAPGAGGGYRPGGGGGTGPMWQQISDALQSCKARLKADVPKLEAIIAKTWGKEDELKQLKSELDALDRKITVTVALAPKHETVADNADGEEIKPVVPQQQPSNITPPQSSK